MRTGGTVTTEKFLPDSTALFCCEAMDHTVLEDDHYRFSLTMPDEIPMILTGAELIDVARACVLVLKLGRGRNTRRAVIELLDFLEGCIGIEDPA